MLSLPLPEKGYKKKEKISSYLKIASLVCLNLFDYIRARYARVLD
jgi:hypothetical protein